MTIQLITGTPGAGKTTYSVAEVIAKEIGRKIPLDNETCINLGLDLGTIVQRRILNAGVRGLKIEHERLPHILTRDRVLPSEVAFWNEMVSEVIDGKRVDTDQPVHQRLASDPPREDIPAMVQNWWLWCKPGDLIVVDECQFVAPRGTLGRKPPYWIEALSIHRHYGVDFLLITQDVQGIDTFIRGKVGLHSHVRSVMGTSMCMVYTWDHCSNTERTSLANKKAWLRRAKHYALFHSSIAHVAPPTSGRMGLVGALVLLVAVMIGFPMFLGKFGKKDDAGLAIPASSTHTAPASSPPEAPQTVSDALPRIVGCIDAPGGGYCIDDKGGRVDIAPAVVAWNSRNIGGLIKHDMSPLTASNRPDVAARQPVDVHPTHIGIEGPKPRNPVRDMSSRMEHHGGGPAEPHAATDGAALASMRAR